eukprot:EG_transcript_20092
MGLQEDAEVAILLQRGLHHPDSFIRIACETAPKAGECAQHERIIAAKDEQLRQLMAKLETTQALSRKNVAALEADLKQKDTTLRGQADSLRKANMEADKMAYVVRALQFYQYQAPGSEAAEEQGGAVKELQAVRQRYLGPPARLIMAASECKALRADLEDCSKTVQEQMHVMRRALKKDGDMVQQLVDHMAHQMNLAMGDLAHLHRLRLKQPEECRLPHLTEDAVRVLQDLVHTLSAAVGHLVVLAGTDVRLEPVEFTEVKPDLRPIGAGLAKIRKHVRMAAVRLTDAPPDPAPLPAATPATPPPAPPPVFA